jgi:hypothetical protein
MTRYRHDEISFETPAEWLDSTVASFHPTPSAPGSPPVPIITMHQEPLAPGATLNLHADRLLMQLTRVRPVIDLLSREETVITDRPVILIRFHFMPDPEAGMMEQTMALLVSGRDPDCKVAVFSLVCPAAVAEANRPLLATVLRSLRFEEPTPPEPARTPSTPPPAPTATVIPMPSFRNRR